MNETFTPTQEKVPTKQEIAKQELDDFFSAFPEEDETNTYRRGMFENIFEKDPDAIEKIAESTKDSREVWQKLRERAWETLEKVGKDVDWAEFEHELQYLITKEGQGNAEKEFDPTVLTDVNNPKFKFYEAYGKYSPDKIDTLEKLNYHLLNKHRFDGLSKEDINEIVEAEEDFLDAKSLHTQIDNQLSGMIYNRHINILGNELKERDNQETLDVALSPILDTINGLSYNKKLVRSQIYGKLQKLRFAPKFLGDKMDDFVDNLKQDLKKLFNEQKEN